MTTPRPSERATRLLDRPSGAVSTPRASRSRRAAALLACAGLTGLLAGLAGCGSQAPTASGTATTSPATAAGSSAPATQSATHLSEPNSPAPGGQPQQSAGGPATTSATSPSPRRSTPAPTRTGGTRAQTPAAGELPKDGGDYGDELISAWRAGDSAAMAALTSPAAAAALGRAKAPADLLLVACEDGMCSWSSESGRRLTLTFDESKLADGAQHAVTAAKVS